MPSDAHRLLSPRPARSLAAALAALGLTGCNGHEWFALAGYEQASFKNDVDVVFIVDNSPSMMQEAEALAVNFDLFIAQLADAEAGGQVTETLSNAVDNYITYTTNRAAVLDYQLGITTTTVAPSEGAEATLEPGEAGTLVGEVLARGDAGVYDEFLESLLCDTTNWDQTLLSQESWECGAEGTPDRISEDYLDCLCGDRWRDNQGGGSEQPLESALLLLCRATPDPPEVCYHTYAGTSVDVDDENTFGDSDVMSEPDMVREGATTVFVVVTDEGDNSTQFLSVGDEDASFYLSSFEQFPTQVKFAVIGPRVDDGNNQASACDQTGTRDTVAYWSVNRLVQVTRETGGFYADISDGADTIGAPCDTADFAVYLEQLGQLLVNLVTAFELASIPDISTIRVFVDGSEVAQSPVSETGDDPTTGWTYEPSQNAVVFWGDSIPDYNSDVQIYYRPLEGKPRELPF